MKKKLHCYIFAASGFNLFLILMDKKRRLPGKNLLYATLAGRNTPLCIAG
jgi:hypothetical protein